ncbi:MAG: DUF1552 domain-containing protein [Polyangiaceae bacterium]
MFLTGAAGATLAIPFLASLLPRGAKAAPGARKRFIALATDHGGIWQESMYPADAILSPAGNYAGRAIRAGALPTTSGALSPVLTANGSVLTPALIQKLNVVRGLDVPFYLAHHRGGHLGNYADNDGNGTDGKTLQPDKLPTIDQVLAWSSTFYGSLDTIKERSLVVGTHGMSWNWSSPSNKTGEITAITPENDSLALFNKIFVPPPDPGTQRPLVVDRVLEDYKRLRTSNRRLSPADKQRLDDHLDRLDELQRKLNVNVSCGDVDVPTGSSTEESQKSTFVVDPEGQKRFFQLFNDVIVAAISCDTCRIAAVHCGETFSDFTGNWHNDVAHEAAKPDGVKQAIIEAAHQRFFEDVFVDLAAKLDAIKETEGTALDSTLLQWTQESGCVTHDPIELPVITAGGAGGFFKTGQYVDYRDLNNQAHSPAADNAVTSHTGLLYNQWLGTVLQSMGLDPAEYEDGVNGGYGKLLLSTETWWAGYQAYGAKETSVMGEVLPLLKA